MTSWSVLSLIDTRPLSYVKRGVDLLPTFMNRNSRWVRTTRGQASATQLQQNWMKRVCAGETTWRRVWREVSTLRRPQIRARRVGERVKVAKFRKINSQFKLRFINKIEMLDHIRDDLQSCKKAVTNRMQILPIRVIRTVCLITALWFIELGLSGSLITVLRAKASVPHTTRREIWRPLPWRNLSNCSRVESPKFQAITPWRIFPNNEDKGLDQTLHLLRWQDSTANSPCQRGTSKLGITVTQLVCHS